MQFSVAGSNKRTRTIIGTALAQLGVEVTLANSPQAKAPPAPPLPASRLWGFSGSRQPQGSRECQPPQVDFRRHGRAAHQSQPCGATASRAGSDGASGLPSSSKHAGARSGAATPGGAGGILLVGSVTPRGLEAPVSAPCESGQPIDRHVTFPPTFRPAPPYLASCCPVALGRTEHATNPARSGHLWASPSSAAPATSPPARCPQPAGRPATPRPTPWTVVGQHDPSVFEAKVRASCLI